MPVKKNRSYRFISAFLIVGFIALIFASVYAPRPLDWSYSYSRTHTIPLGTRLIFNVLESLFPDQEIIVAHSPLTEFLRATTPVNTNFIFINDTYNADSLEINKLLSVAAAGNHVFIAAERFSSWFTDTLQLKINHSNPPSLILLNDSTGFNFTNRRLRNAHHYWYNKVATNHHFTAYDSTKTTVLGYNNHGKTNFIKVNHGNGAIYINSNPIFFTNYHLLSGNKSEYIFKCLSYLPITSTVWDEYYKTGIPSIGSEINFILENPSLRIAWYLLMASIVIYFIFEGKRRQRPVPEITPPQNHSLSFIETVGRLYFIRSDHLDIARKRFLFFQNTIRSKYFINLASDESQTIEEISKKSGIPERRIAALFKMARNLSKVKRISQEDLHQFNRQLEFFYKNCQ